MWRSMTRWHLDNICNLKPIERNQGMAFLVHLRLKILLNVYNCVLLLFLLFLESTCSVTLFSSCHSFILSVVFLGSKEVESVTKAFGRVVPKWVFIYLNFRYLFDSIETMISMLVLSVEALLALLLSTSIREVNDKRHSKNTIAFNG